MVGRVGRWARLVGRWAHRVGRWARLVRRLPGLARKSNWFLWSPVALSVCDLGTTGHRRVGSVRQMAGSVRVASVRAAGCRSLQLRYAYARVESLSPPPSLSLSLSFSPSLFLLSSLPCPFAGMQGLAKPTCAYAALRARSNTLVLYIYIYSPPCSCPPRRTQRIPIARHPCQY